MSGIPFHSTGYGKRFFDGQLPSLLAELKMLNVNLDRIAKRTGFLLDMNTDVHAIAESLAILAEALAVITETDTTKQRMAEVKAKMNDLLEAIREIGQEAGYEGSGEVTPGGDGS